jgi:hypothetical protein
MEITQDKGDCIGDYSYNSIRNTKSLYWRLYGNYHCHCKGNIVAVDDHRAGLPQMFMTRGSPERLWEVSLGKLWTFIVHRSFPRETQSLSGLPLAMNISGNLLCLCCEIARDTAQRKTNFVIVNCLYFVLSKMSKFIIVLLLAVYLFSFSEAVEYKDNNQYKVMETQKFKRFTDRALAQLYLYIFFDDK